MANYSFRVFPPWKKYNFGKAAGCVNTRCFQFVYNKPDWRHQDLTDVVCQNGDDLVGILWSLLPLLKFIHQQEANRQPLIYYFWQHVCVSVNILCSFEMFAPVSRNDTMSSIVTAGQLQFFSVATSICTEATFWKLFIQSVLPTCILAQQLISVNQNSLKPPKCIMLY